MDDDQNPIDEEKKEEEAVDSVPEAGEAEETETPAPAEEGGEEAPAEEGGEEVPADEEKKEDEPETPAAE